jgi:methionyl-tRNA formyltransferase
MTPTFWFSAKMEKPFATEALDLLHQARASVVQDRIFMSPKAEMPFDYIISYISPHIFTQNQLAKVQKAAINFHPGPPEYPGIGCTNFALYNGEKEFGITVHHMEPKVDSGEIIMVKRFPITKGETVWSLSQKCYAYIFVAFTEILPYLLAGRTDMGFNFIRGAKWTRKPYTRKELDELCVITKDMSDREVARRVRATTYPNMPGAYIRLGGYKFDANTQEQKLKKAKHI